MQGFQAYITVLGCQAPVDCSSLGTVQTSNVPVSDT